MLLIFITDLFCLCIILQIIIPFAHTQASLHGVYHVFIAIHVISADIKNKIGIHTILLHFHDQRINLSFTFDSTYFIQFGFNGSNAFLIQLYAVHSNIIKFTYFLCNAARFVFARCQTFNQPAQLPAIVLGKHIKRTETRIFVCQRMVFHPSATSVLIETGARQGSCVKVGKVNAGRKYGLFLTVASCCHTTDCKDW